MVDIMDVQGFQAELARVCRLLDSDKATERKKNVDKLKQLLQQTEVLRLLDSNSDGGKKNVITWDFILKSTVAHVTREIECLRVHKPRNSQTVSSTVANNKEKKKRELMSMLKFVIRTADERERCRLNGKDFVHHIITILKSQEKSFYSDYQNILLKYILTSRMYCCELTSQMWQDLIDIVSGIINSNAGERSLSAKTFLYIITAAVTQVDLTSNRLFKFFTNVLSDIRKETNVEVLGYLLNSLILFCNTVAIDCRGQLCQLGEDLVPALLQIWSKPHPIVKECLIKFMMLQMSAHHPNGVHLEKDGAWSTNTAHWKKCLQKLFESISTEIQQANLRIRGQSSKLASGLNDALIELCADICHQLYWFHSEESVILVDCSVFEGPSSSKRRKIDIGWNVLRDTLTNSQETPALLGWLQITAKLLSKFPNSLPNQEYIPLLMTLHQLQLECKRQEIVSSVMNCLQFLATCCVQLPETSVDGMSAKTTWRNIWLAALRTCSSHGLQDSSFNLLESIVKEKLADPDTEPWKLLTDTGSNSSECSLQFVWRCLTTFPLPEHFHYTSQVFQNDPSHYPLRHQLFDWLLPSVNKIEQQGNNVSVCYSKIFSRLPMDLLSHVLVILTQRVCSTALVETLDTKRCSSRGRMAQQADKALKEMENIYILSSFDKRAKTNLVDPVKFNELKSISADNDTVKELLDDLVQRMIEISQKLLETSDLECSTISSPQGSIHVPACEVLARFSSLSTKVLGLLLYMNAFNFKDLTESPLYLVTTHVLKAVTSGMAESLRHKDEAGKVVFWQSFTETLSDLFLCSSFSTKSDRNMIKALMKVVRSLTPLELIECVMQIITKEPRKFGKTRMVIDEFDGTVVDKEDVMDDFEKFETTDSIPSSMSDQNIYSDNLSENDKTRICYMKILSSWCTCLDDVMHEPSERLQNQIFEYFESEEFNVILKPIHSKLFFAAAFILCSGRIQARHILVILQNLRIFISKHRKDQEYCEEGLRLLTLLAAQFGGLDHGEDLKDAQMRSLHLLKAFWNLRDTGYSWSVRLQIAKCMDTFIRFDPDKKWASFVLEDNNNVSIVHISHLFPKLLCDPSHAVRMYMAEAIGILFLKFKSETSSVPEDPAIQDELFDIVSRSLAQSLVVEKQLRESEDVNRAASLLSAFKTIVTVSCWCEPKVVCLLFQATKERNLDQEIVSKVICQISATLGYASTHDFIRTHIGRVVDNWLNLGFKLADFPVQAVQFKSLADFLRTHHPAIMPQLIWHFKETESLKTVGREIGNGGDWTEFLMHDFCKIMSIIVPSFAEQSHQKTTIDNKGSQELELNKPRAYDCYAFVENILQKDVTDKWMVMKFDELIVELLLKMHDSPSEFSDVSQFLRDYDPPTEQPHFTSHAIKATLDYLTKCHHGSNTLISILCKRKENIQKILLRLSKHLEDTHIFHKRRSFLAMYRLFVLLLLEDLNKGLAGTWAFVVRDIVYTLIRTISRHSPRNVFRIEGVIRDEKINIEQDSDVFTASCDLLYQVCKVSLSCCPQEIGHHLLDIVNEIIPFVLTKDNQSKKAVALLKYLIVDNKTCLQSSICCLDPFPDQPEFAVFNEAYWSVRRNNEYFTLSAEIEHYLSVSGRCRTTSRVEGLRYLRSRFTHHKDELQEAVRIDLNGSSLNGLPVKLLRRLVLLCKNSTNEVKVEVGKLLAEIGSPALYLSSFNLSTSQEDEKYNYSKACEAFEGDEENCRNCRILHELNDCLIDRDIKKVAAAASSLKDILGKPSILELMKCYEEQKIDHLFGYLEPFKATKRKKKSEEEECTEKSKFARRFSEVVRDAELWNPRYFSSHAEWISTLTSTIIDSGVIQDEVLQCLSQVCKVHALFADLVFPYLIHHILLNHGETYRDHLSEEIRKIFSSHVHTCLNQSRASTPIITTAENTISNTATHDSVHSVLNVINYLRKQPRPIRCGTSWESNFWLDLNYLELAEAALKCSAYCTAVLYVEIWKDIQRATSCSSESSTGDVSTEISSESTEESSDTNYQAILFEAYASIGEPDAVYGSGVSTDIKARIHTYEQEKQWGKALRSYDLYCRQSGNQSCMGAVQALKAFGLDHVAYKYLKGLQDETQNEFLELQYESAWRNRIWNVEKDISDKFTVDNKGFNQCVYDNILSLRNKDLKLFHFSIDECRIKIVEGLCRTNTESMCEVYPQILRLECLRELEQAKKIYGSNDDYDTLLDQWIMNIPDGFNELDLIEPILSLRTVLLQELLSLSQTDPTTVKLRQCLLPALIKHCEMVSKLARHAGSYQISEIAIATLKDIKTGENDVSSCCSWKIEEAKVFWFQGEQETAMRQLKQINLALKNNAGTGRLLYAQTLGLYGSWLAETRSENPNTIMEKYLDKTVELMESLSGGQQSSIEAFFSLARFADSQYKNIEDYMKSSVFENKRSIMNKLKSEVANLKEHGVDKGRYLRELSLQSQSDEKELTQMKEDRLKYLQKAVRNYIRCIQVGGKYDLQIFRICSLWMDNSKDDTINKLVEQGLFSTQNDNMSVESRKFIPLMYQLAARLGAKTHQNGIFQSVLSKLICEAAVAHPHHVIWIVLALINADKDSKYLSSGGGKKVGRLSKKTNQQPADSYIDEERVKAALAVLEDVRKSRQGIVSSMEKLCEAYIELAYYDVSQHKSKTGPLSLPDVALKRIANLNNVGLPTIDIQIDPSCRYQNIISIANFDPKYQLCGGINLPKILLCVGSDGVKRRQLIKGKDDLRQDAVMQQVFGMVNTLLQENVETRKRNLKIRTYKVIPLSQRSGLVEWCGNTTPLGNFLIGVQGKSLGAHQRYYPRDLSSLDCRKKIQAVDRTNVHQRYKVYKEVISRFHPVFRHFFLEKFPDPSQWFEKRLAYTRSVATASIVGYIVGLGDRHVQNILIDCNTAELIHIDLGVAFEQGKMLPTPETVPFRLTRDLVDGMGISGVEGVFRRCCEKTMEVMRTSQESLSTIVQVLLYDPLYVWTLSPLKAMSLQRKPDLDTSDVTPADTDVLETGNNPSLNETSVNKMAQRVLVRLRQKLDGVEDGTVLSVKGQVNHVIREARDPKNLCRLFPGWQPWI